MEEWKTIFAVNSEERESKRKRWVGDSLSYALNLTWNRHYLRFDLISRQCCTVYAIWARPNQQLQTNWFNLAEQINHILILYTLHFSVRPRIQKYLLYIYIYKFFFYITPFFIFRRNPKLSYQIRIIIYQYIFFLKPYTNTYS